MSKYGAKKTTVDGITFDSKAEAKRYEVLRLLERQGLISDIQRQVSYELVPGVRLHGEKRKRPAIRYVADFEYETHLGVIVVEDCKGRANGGKGLLTPVFNLKRHLMKVLLGIEINIT